MATSTLTSKGQTTIPLEIRKHLNLRPDDRMEFIIQKNGHVLLLPATLEVSELEGVLPAPKKPVPLTEMERVIRRRGANRRRD